MQKLGHDPEPMMVNRIGEDHWQFKDLKTQAELIVSLDSRGRPRGTFLPANITPPRRAVQTPNAGVCGAGREPGGISTMDTCCI